MPNQNIPNENLMNKLKEEMMAPPPVPENPKQRGGLFS